MHFNQIYPLPSPFHTHPTLCLFFETHNVQFGLSIHSWMCGFHWRAVISLNTEPMKETNFPCWNSICLTLWEPGLFGYIDLDGGGRTLDFPWGREPWLLLGLEREGKVG